MKVIGVTGGLGRSRQQEEQSYKQEHVKQSATLEQAENAEKPTEQKSHRGRH